MGGILVYFFLSLATIVSGISIYSYNLIVENKKQLENYREADGITKKIKSIKKIIETESIRGKINKNSLASIPLIRNKPISQIVSNLDGVQEKTLNQYATAVNKILESNPNASDAEFSCSSLVATDDIDMESCLKVENANIQFFSLEQGTIKYKLDTDVNTRVNLIKSNRLEKAYSKTSEENNITTTKEQLILSSKAFAYENKAIKKTIRLVEDAIAHKRYIYASQLLSSADTLNENFSLIVRMRSEIVRKELIASNNAIYEQTLNESGIMEDTTEIRFNKQDATKIPTEIKSSIILSIIRTNKAGASKYAQSLDGRELIALIANDISSFPENYPEINNEERSSFLEISELIANNSFSDEVLIN